MYWLGRNFISICQNMPRHINLKTLETDNKTATASLVASRDKNPTASSSAQSLSYSIFASIVFLSAYFLLIKKQTEIFYFKLFPEFLLTSAVILFVFGVNKSNK